MDKVMGLFCTNLGPLQKAAWDHSPSLCYAKIQQGSSCLQARRVHSKGPAMYILTQTSTADLEKIVFIIIIFICTFVCLCTCVCVCACV